MKPEEALSAARRAAVTTDPTVDLSIEPTEAVTRERLMRYAVIEPDLSQVRSTRPGLAGKAMTTLKHGIVRFMRQYHGSVHAQQTRFNLMLVAYITALEERVIALEERVPADDD